MAVKAAEDLSHVTAILVVHDGAKWLPEVVASLTSQKRAVDQIIAVDTGSIDSSVALVKGAKIPVLSLDRESGFGDAIWAAIQTLPTPTSPENEWLWILHDDCAMHPEALDKLLEALAEKPQAIMAGPKLLGWRDKSHLLEIGVSIASDGARWTGLEAHEYDQGQHDGVRDVLAVSTAGALVRRDVFVELGGFDPNLSLFRDDVDFGWRARVAGHSVIAVSDAKGFHAQAAASERRSADVKEAFLHRPLLLDRRNAAYVLLANSSWWMLPWVVLQLLGSATARAIGYLLAKLPGYASDEMLALVTLVIHPREILSARKFRKSHRLLSARAVKEFIPHRRHQLRAASERLIDSIRSTLLPGVSDSSTVLEPLNEDEDLLTPAKPGRWWTIFKQPKALAGFGILILIAIWSRHRYGALVGGALVQTPESAQDLWQKYFESWHQIGMGTDQGAPTWLAVIALGSTILLGKADLFITLLFFFAPLFFMLASFRLFSKITQHNWLRVMASFLYAISPVAIASINSGHIGTIFTLILLPYIGLLIRDWLTIENTTWRKIFLLSLLLSLSYAFSMQVFLYLFIATLIVSTIDFARYGNIRFFHERLRRRATLVVSPLLVNVPWSFSILFEPKRLFLEPGLTIAGGGPNFALLANPGGPGALPWWSISPISLVLLVALFSSTKVRIISYFGSGALCAAVIFGSLSFSGHGNSSSVRIWTGSLIAIATICAIASGVLILDRLREVLIVTNFHYRHILAGLLVAVTTLYSFSTISWLVTAGADSPVRATNSKVLPPFLGIEDGVKTIVLRQIKSDDANSLQYFIARGHDVLLSEPDIAPDESPEIANAIKEIADGSGISASRVLGRYGIQYVFAKSPTNNEVVRTIDGLGGFVRSSATRAGIVWKVSNAYSRINFIDLNGKITEIPSTSVSAQTQIYSPGTILLTDSYSESWKIFQNGNTLERTKNANGFPQFAVTQPGEISLIHDGSIRRGLLSLQFIFFITLIVLAAPAGRKRREMSEGDLT
jgi:glycosyltransferase involved in cell wall biosynthesis